MPNVLCTLRRVQRLEQARVTRRSPFEVAYGRMDAFADKVQVDVAAGKLDRKDITMVLAALHRWHRDGSGRHGGTIATVCGTADDRRGV